MSPACMSAKSENIPNFMAEWIKLIIPSTFKFTHANLIIYTYVNPDLNQIRFNSQQKSDLK